MSNIEDMLSKQMTPRELHKLKKILNKVYFYTIATSVDNYPQATNVQPILTKDWHLRFISDQKRKKIRNLRTNSNTWLIADATGLFHIPKVVYIKGIANVEQLTKDSLEDFLRQHGPISRRILRSIARDSIDHYAITTVIPEKFITVGIFGKLEEEISFNVKKEAIT